jgi:hypothetical protein
VRRVVVTWTIVACACGARTELGVLEHDASLDAAHDSSIDVLDAHDSSIDALDAQTIDVGVPEAPPVCDYGTLVEDVFGTTVDWNGGASLPPGHYAITYVDGCMKYSTSQGWTVNAYADGPDTLFVVTSGNAQLGTAPGTVGFLQGQGGFADFDACVSANLANDVPLEFDFAGGPIGLMLDDNPYTDNVAGENGRSPTYRLSSCP